MVGLRRVVASLRPSPDGSSLELGKGSSSERILYRDRIDKQVDGRERNDDERAVTRKEAKRSSSDLASHSFKL